ncbi:MAG: hypothetical protein R6W69_09465 [Anaerolineales bacterium]|jgi:hypothetical protein
MAKKERSAYFYRIRVRDQLDQRWADWFDGFQMQSVGEDTVVAGYISDQAALHGVLAKIRDLGLMILLVEYLENHVETGET